MSQILDTLFLKRFCLPYDSDITLFENGESKIAPCLCGNYNHASCVLQGKQKRFTKG